MGLGCCTWAERGGGMRELSIPTANWKASSFLKGGMTGEIHPEKGNEHLKHPNQTKRSDT